MFYVILVLSLISTAQAIDDVSCDQVFQNFVMHLEQYRKPYHSQWFQYKNRKREKPRVFNFNSKNIYRTNQKMAQIVLNEKATQFEWMVLQLKRGDTVKIEDQKFVLGEFLGAGNATHIFALEGFDDRVIRLPYLAEPFMSRFHSSERLDIVFKFPRSFSEKMKDQKNAVRIHYEDKKQRILVVDRVLGRKETGTHFLKAWYKRVFNEEVPSIIEFNLDMLKDDKVSKLVRVMADNFGVYFWDREAGTADISLNAARQYLWGNTSENAEKNWYLVDIE